MENKMSNKNPFEIRADILSMAKDYMDKHYEVNVMFAKQMFEQGKKSAEEMQELMKPYTTEELTKKATEMYAFVSKKD
jgi:hypothetical protein